MAAGRKRVFFFVVEEVVHIAANNEDARLIAVEEACSFEEGQKRLQASADLVFRRFIGSLALYSGKELGPSSWLRCWIRCCHWAAAISDRLGEAEPACRTRYCRPICGRIRGIRLLEDLPSVPASSRLTAGAGFHFCAQLTQFASLASVVSSPMPEMASLSSCSCLLLMTSATASLRSSLSASSISRTWPCSCTL